MAADIAPPLRDKRLRDLFILAVATAVMVALAIAALILRAQEVSPGFDPVPVFPALKSQVNTVAKIVIESQKGKFEAVRDPDGTWRLPGKGGYPAEFEQVNRAINGMAELELAEQKTARYDWHEALDLVMPEEGGKAVVLTLLDGAGTELAALVAGKVQDVPSVGSLGTLYVRRKGEDQTWLARGFLTLQTDQAAWLDKTLFAMPRERIKSADIAPPEGASYTLSRAKKEDRDFTLSAVPEGRQPLAGNVLSGIAGALEGITFDDVMAFKPEDFAKASRAAFTTFDGLTVIVSVMSNGEGYWANFNAIGEAVPPAEGAPVPAEGEAAPDAVGEAKAINARVAGWAYRLPRYKGELLQTAFDTLLLPAQPEGEAPAAPGLTPVPAQP
ncbi:MAG: DUF4340 domain-containing protein [Alphaproteobacteria bacterium]|nr:DUF4340 domain-containing protein [Alphaproteobacteria bacterium]